MRVRNATIAMAVLSMLSYHALAAEGDVACRSGPFEAGESPAIHSALIEFLRSNKKDPPEITRVKNGIVSFYVGGFVNDGVITWYAYDADRWLFISILGGDGPRLKAVPKSSLLDKNQFVRFTTAVGYKRSEFITVVRASAEQAHLLSCLMNDSIAEKPSSESNEMPTDTVESDLYIIKDEQNFGTGSAQTGEKLRVAISDPLQKPIMHAYGR